MRESTLITLFFASLILTLSPHGSVIAGDPDASDLAADLRATEEAFARTMADRDHGAFLSFLAEETVFFGRTGEIRGREAVAAAWRPLYEGPEAPFSWEPETVVVLDSGTLALSSGPVRDPAGQRFATFNSIWRLEPDGHWRIVFDKGSQDCASPPAVE